MNTKPQLCVSDLNDEPVFPRIGKLRLGIKTEEKNGNSHPRNTDYFTFHCSSEVLVKRFRDLYGEKPAAVRIMLLSENIDKVFPNSLTWYTGMLARCTGDNQSATRMWKDVAPQIQRQLAAPVSPFTKVTIPCPCDRKGDTCTLKGRFNVMLPEIQPAAKVEVITGSIANLKEIRGVLRSYKEMLGRISFVPFTLSRHAVRMQYQGKSAVQYLIQLLYEGDMTAVNELRTSCNIPPLPFSTLRGGRPTAIAPPEATMEAEHEKEDPANIIREKGAAEESEAGKGKETDETDGIKTVPPPAGTDTPEPQTKVPVTVITEAPRAMIPQANILSRTANPTLESGASSAAKPADEPESAPSAAPEVKGTPPAGRIGAQEKPTEPRPRDAPAGKPGAPTRER